MQISFRPIKNEDYEFLWRLHNAALKEYVTKTWGWNEELQRYLFKQNFSLENGEIIVVEGKDAGFLDVREKERERVLISIRLLPEFQNKGVGTKVIQGLLAEARAKNKPVRLQVLKINPAQRLYKRLGFEVFDETDTHFLMRTPEFEQ